MSLDILEMFSATLSGPTVRQASTWLGESESATRMAMRSVGPTLLMAALQRVTAPKGRVEIFQQVTREGIDPGIAARFGSLWNDRGSMESVLGAGESLCRLLLGGRAGSVANAVSQSAGVRPDSAMTLLSLGAALLFGMLKKYVATNDLDASALSSLLMRQQRSLERSGLDDRIVGALGFGSMPEMLASLRAHAATPVAKKSVPMRDRAWVPWAAAAAIAVVGALFLANKTAEHQEAPLGAVQIAELADGAGSTYSTSPTTVYFESGNANLGADDRQRIASVAESAKRTERPVAITGYADGSGDEQTNRDLARDRAQAVRDALVNEGVEEGRIVMDPPRDVVGAGSDERARRVELVMR